MAIQSLLSGWCQDFDYYKTANPERVSIIRNLNNLGKIKMAEEEALDLDSSNENGENGGDDGAGKKKGGSKLIIIIVAVLVLLIVGAAAFFLMRSGGEEQSDSKEDAEEVEKMPAMYIPLKPPFVTQFNDSGRQRYLQLELSLMTRSDEGYQNLIKHLPKIRSNLLNVVGAQLFEDLKTPEGKDAMREALAEEIRTLMEEETGAPQIEDVYYTTFIIQ